MTASWLSSPAPEEKLEAAAAEVRRARAVRDRARYFLEQTRIVAPPDSEGKVGEEKEVGTRGKQKGDIVD